MNIRQTPTFPSFKLTLHYLRFKNKKPPSYFVYGDRLLSVLHARLRNKCSVLNADLFKVNLVENAKCICGCINENAEHFLLHCRRFDTQRACMINEINGLNVIGIRINVELLLFGCEDFSIDENCELFSAVHKFIRDTQRFSFRQQP